MIWSLQAPKRGVVSMPTYVSLLHWTDQGIKNYKISPSRAAEVTKQVENSGGRVRELLWTVGEYDLVAVMEFPTMKQRPRFSFRSGLSATSARTRCGPSTPTR
jgi:uncharacterized protein with GYD domain